MFALTPKQFCGVELRKAKGKNVRGDYVWWNALTAVLGRYEITLAQLEAIRQGQVSVGMPACAALAAWGKPTRLSKTSNALGTHQLWAYDHGYLYFDDNETLVSIERH